MMKGERRGCIRLKDAFVGYDNEDDITFTITVDEKTFHLQSKNLDEREKWVSRIERTIRLHSTKSNQMLNNLDFAAADLDKSINSKFTSSINSAELFNNNLTLTESQTHNANEDNFNDVASTSNTSRLNKSDFLQFDLNLTESDAYLQLLIEQLKDLELKRSDFLKNKSNADSKSSIQLNNGGSEISIHSSREESVNSGEDLTSTKEQDLQNIDTVINATEVSRFLV